MTLQIRKTLETDKETAFTRENIRQLNEMTGMDSEAERKKAMLEFEEEEQMANQIFKIY